MKYLLTRFMPKISARLCIRIFIVMCFIQYGTFAQTEESRKLELARSYEESGNTREASRLYQELFVKNKQNEEYFEGVVRTLLALDQPNSLLPIVQEKANTDKSSQIHALLGTLLWTTGKQAEAEKSWNTALTSCGTMAECYRDIATMQSRLRLYDKAVATLLTARTMLESPILFADELSQFYAATGNVEKGTEEVMNLFAATKSLGLAQGRLSALMLTENANAHISKALENALSERPDDYNVMMLQLWFFRESKQYRKGLTAAQSLDERTRSQGRELLNFANLASKENEYDIAMEAFTKVMDFGKNTPYFITALYGYASSLEEKLLDRDSVSREEANGIINKYQEIIKDFPDNQLANECRYRVAQIHNKYLSEPDKTIENLDFIIKTSAGSTLAANAALFAGDIRLQQGDMKSASNYYQTVARMLSRSLQRESDKAKYSLALMEYYAGYIDSAKNKLAALAAKTESDISNDALTYILLFEDNEDYTSCLQLYAKMELATIRKNLSDVEQFYKQLQGMCAKADLMEKAHLEYAKALIAQRKYNDAEQNLRRFILDFSDSIYGDIALSLLGDVLRRSSKKDEALSIYGELLIKFPRSILLQETREKIRKLRGA